MAAPVGYDPGQSLLAGGSGHLEAMRGGGWRGGAGETFDENTANSIYGFISKQIKYQDEDESANDYGKRITVPITTSPTLQTAQKEGRLPPEGINHIVQAVIAIATVKEGDDIDTFVAKIRQVIDDGAINEELEGDGYKTKNSISGGTGTDPSKLLQVIGNVASFLKEKKLFEGGAGADAPAAPAVNEPVPEAAAPAPAAAVEAEAAAEAPALEAAPEAANAPEAAAPVATETTAELEPETVTYFGKKVPKNIIERLKAFAPIPEEAGTEREQQAQFFSAIRNLLIDVQGRKDASRGVITIEIPTNVPASGTGGAGAGAGLPEQPAKRTGGTRRSRKTRRRNKPLRKARTRRH